MEKPSLDYTGLIIKPRKSYTGNIWLCSLKNFEDNLYIRQNMGNISPLFFLHTSDWECSLQKGNLCACKVVKQAYFSFQGHLWKMYSNIVDEYELHELILNYELLLHWIRISKFSEFAKKKFTWMKVLDELKMKILLYTPLHWNWLVEIQFIFSNVIVEWKKIFFNLTFY